MSADLPPLDDAQIRAALRLFLEERFADGADTLFIDEMGLCRGQVRVDLAVVNGLLHGYEIKSDRDRLDRLPSQVEVYGSVLDRATLVVGARHLEACLQLLPPWWGVLLADCREGGISLNAVRPAKTNPDQIPRALVELLWRDEALALLEAREADAGVRSKPRAAIWDRMCEAFLPHEIAVAVRDHLRRRAVSSAVAQPS